MTESTEAPIWTAVLSEIGQDPWRVALVDANADVIRTHPIGFDTQLQAERAAARLNIRDEKVAR